MYAYQEITFSNLLSSIQLSLDKLQELVSLLYTSVVSKLALDYPFLAQYLSLFNQFGNSDLKGTRSFKLLVARRTHKVHYTCLPLLNYPLM